MLFPFDERLGVQPQQFAQLAQEFRRGIKAEWGLQVRLAQHLRQTPAKFAVHADIHIGIHQIAHFGDMRAQRHDHVDDSADPLDQPANLMQVRRHVKRAIHRPKDVDARGITVLALFLGRHPALGHAEFSENPGHRPVRRFPLILVNGAGQEPLDIGALWSHTPADHLGNRSGHNHGRQGRVQHLPGAFHRLLSARPHLGFAQTRHDNGQFMRRQRVGVMQHRSDRQVFATHRTVDDNL